MTTMPTPTPDAAMTTVVLPYGACPWRQVIGDPAVPTEKDSGGSPFRFTLDTPHSPAACRALGGELAWWATAQAVRHSDTPNAWPPPAAVTVTRVGPNQWSATGPGGALTITRQ